MRNESNDFLGHFLVDVVVTAERAGVFGVAVDLAGSLEKGRQNRYRNAISGCQARRRPLVYHVILFS